MNFLFLLGDIFSTTSDSAAIIEITKFLNEYIVGFTIVLCVAGAITAIVLAAAMSRAEDLQKANQFKNKLIGMVVTILIVIVLVWLTAWLLTSHNDIISFFREGFNFGQNPPTPTPTPNPPPPPTQTPTAWRPFL